MTAFRQQPELGSPTAIESELRGSLPNTEARRLLQHYTETLSASLAWFDAPESPYREAIVPMALENTTVLSSLLALSAADLQSQASHEVGEHGELTESVERYQSEAMGSLSSDMKRLAEEGEHFVTEDPTQARSMLVSLFLLIMTSIRLGDDHILRLHVRTADILVQAWLRAHETLALSEGSLEATLINCICDCQVWCSITRTVVFPDRWRSLSSGHADAALSGLVLATHAITLHERQTSESHRRPASDPLDHLLDQLADARLRASQFLETVDVQSQSSLETLIEMLYQAGLIYLYRVCLAADAADSAAALPLRRLFEALDRATNMTLAHYMVWPLFIAGTESVGNTERQSLVATKMEEVIRMSGSLGRPRVLAFLRELWERGGRQENVRWIQIAKQWDDEGNAITLF